MADLTYTATGEIDIANRLVKLDLFLPQEDPDNPYEFYYNFDLSKKTIFDKQYNVIFCHLRLERDGGNPLNSQTKGHQLTLDVDKLIKSGFIGNTNFNFDLEETLFLLLHDISRTEVLKDAELLFNNIENISEKVKSIDNHNIQLPDANLVLRPRRLGMSIIKP